MYPLYQQVEEGKLCCGAECGSMFPEDDGKQSLVVNQSHAEAIKRQATTQH